VGLEPSCPAIFEGIEWSTARVMEQTRGRLSALGLHWNDVARLWDVDRAEDVARWQALQRAEAGLIGAEE